MIRHRTRYRVVGRRSPHLFAETFGSEAHAPDPRYDQVRQDHRRQRFRCVISDSSPAPRVAAAPSCSARRASRPRSPHRPATPRHPPLAGTDWTMTTDGVTATLQIDGDLAGGSSGCNSYFASVSTDPGLTFGGIGSTMMACPEPQMAFEQQYLTARPRSPTTASPVRP